MFQSDITKSESTLEQAILECLSNDELHTDQDGCTLGGLIMELQDNYPEDVSQCVLRLIAKRRAYVAAPLELADPDTYICPVTWMPSVSNRTEVEKEFGQPHAVDGRGGKKTITFDLYVVNSDEPDFASASVPCAVRGRLMRIDPRVVRSRIPTSCHPKRYRCSLRLMTTIFSSTLISKSGFV